MCYFSYRKAPLEGEDESEIIIKIKGFSYLDHLDTKFIKKVFDFIYAFKSLQNGRHL